MKQKKSIKKIFAFIMLVISFLYFYISIVKDFYAWNGNVGFAFIGLIVFIYAWIVYHYDFY